jgi:hypothetical protein
MRRACASPVRPQVHVPKSVLAERVVDPKKAGYFFLPDGTEDPFWKALRQRCGECATPMYTYRVWPYASGWNAWCHPYI